ncbi:APC family permease [Streptomyces sp. MBT27]|uniref:APC family permease n=1 Tax=Streptomyces sp. MBT27 TaxID=1488356 RepID=UPI00142156C0|nr:APC family permease [Streptomyces sp. MBT27]
MSAIGRSPVDPSGIEPVTGPVGGDRPPPTGIGTRGLIVFYITSLIGAGVLGVPSVTASIAGPASLLSWAVLAFASYPIAVLFAEMSARHVDASGISALVRSGLGHRAADTANTLLVLVYTFGNPVMGVISARYFCHLTGIDDQWVMYLAIGFMLVSVAFNRLGITMGARIQNAALVVLLACLGGAVLLAVPSMSADHYRPFAPHGWTAVGTSSVVAFFSFLGWENVSSVAEEVRDPAHSFRRAIRFAVPVVGLIYLAVAAAYLAVDHGDGTVVMSALLGPDLGRISGTLGDLLALLIVMVATNAWVLGASRLSLAAARQGLLPGRLARTDPRTGAPGRMLLALAVGYTAVLATMGALDVNEDRIVVLTSAVFLLLYVAAAIAALRDRPTPAMRRSAWATGAIALVFLPFTGSALPVAALLALGAFLATGVLARRRGRTVPLPSDEVK